jgi:hydroxymethylpyrimidine pyrophosphatase-like HAD family hydrolase
MAKGVTVTLAITRIFPSALPFAQRLGMTAPIISFQGALIQASGEGKPLLRRTMPLEAAHRLVGLARQWGTQYQFLFRGLPICGGGIW